MPLMPLLFLLVPVRALAHDLRAAFVVLPDHKVLVRCWYTAINGPSPARGAVVAISRAGREHIRGTSDEEGFFTFSYDRAERMTIEVRQGDHVSRTVTIEPTELDGGAGSTSADALADAPGNDAAKAKLEKMVEQSGTQLFKDMLLGVSLILAVAAFILSIRHGKRLRMLEARGKRSSNDGESTERQA
jgi:hypothetical protein